MIRNLSSLIRQGELRTRREDIAISGKDPKLHNLEVQVNTIQACTAAKEGKKGKEGGTVASMDSTLML